MKLRRRILEQRYHKEIEALYSDEPAHSHSKTPTVGRRS